MLLAQIILNKVESNEISYELKKIQLPIVKIYLVLKFYLALGLIN